MEKTKNADLQRLSVEEFKESAKTPIVLVLDDVRSLNNIGSIFRTADAFRLEAIYLCGITACPPNKEIHKTALGATETVAWLYFETVGAAIAALRADHYVICAIEQASESVMLHDYQVERFEKHALVFGNEVKGVSIAAMEACDVCIEIPQVGSKHSLNIAVSAGIVIWDLFLKWNQHAS